jgi:hypothetical protein
VARRKIGRNRRLVTCGYNETKDNTMNLTNAHKDLQACLDDLRAARQVGGWAADQLTDARRSRATELAALIDNAICFCQRLCVCVEADIRTAAAEGGI